MQKKISGSYFLQFFFWMSTRNKIICLGPIVAP